MHILITNDDGITAPGLFFLTRELRKIATVSILAPDRNWSGGGHVKTLDRPLRVKEVKLADGTTGYASDGAPSDCVALALLGFITSKIDLVVSGINPQPNLGHDLTYSGTVTAAMESVIWGVPGIAVSLDSPEDALAEIYYQSAAQVARDVVNNVSIKGLPADTLLNVNVPRKTYTELNGYQVTRQGLRVYRDRLDRRTDPRGRDYFWIGGDAPTGVPEQGTDVGALAQGAVSITPVQLDLTAYPTLQRLSTWHWEKEKSPIP